MKITIKGEAGSSHQNVNDEYEEITGTDRKKFDGVDCQDCFADYMDTIEGVKITGGYMHFEWDNELEKLMVVVIYNSDKLLTVAQGEELIEYTQGQMSDGIGEGFEQFDCTGDDDFLSPWFGGQALTISPTIQEVREEKIGDVVD